MLHRDLCSHADVQERAVLARNQIKASELGHPVHRSDLPLAFWLMPQFTYMTSGKGNSLGLFFSLWQKVSRERREGQSWMENRGFTASSRLYVHTETHLAAVTDVTVESSRRMTTFESGLIKFRCARCLFLKGNPFIFSLWRWVIIAVFVIAQRWLSQKASSPPCGYEKFSNKQRSHTTEGTTTVLVVQSPLALLQQAWTGRRYSW